MCASVTRWTLSQSRLQLTQSRLSLNPKSTLGARHAQQSRLAVAPKVDLPSLANSSWSRPTRVSPPPGPRPPHSASRLRRSSAATDTRAPARKSACPHVAPLGISRSFNGMSFNWRSSTGGIYANGGQVRRFTLDQPSCGAELRSRIAELRSRIAELRLRPCAGEWRRDKPALRGSAMA